MKGLNKPHTNAVTGAISMSRSNVLIIVSPNSPPLHVVKPGFLASFQESHYKLDKEFREFVPSYDSDLRAYDHFL